MSSRDESQKIGVVSFTPRRALPLKLHKTPSGLPVSRKKCYQKLQLCGRVRVVVDVMKGIKWAYVSLTVELLKGSA